MADRNTKALAQQADHLYARGIAAARGGQKTVATTLLRQAVRLDPQHEQAWLWLSGVLDKPDDIAFCLRAVLGINPHNERARRGLTWIEAQIDADATPPTHPRATPLLQPPADTWWATWRAAQSTWLWTFRALLLIPIVLLGGTLAMRAVIVARPLPSFATYQDIPIPTAVPTSEIAQAPPLEPSAEPTTTSQAALHAYFDLIDHERNVLQQATETYRTATDGGRTNIERATATKQLREQVQRSHAALTAVAAPPEIAAAHQLYLEGLAWEQEALNQMIDYYVNFDVKQANRAALRLQEARTQIATATSSWHAFAQQHDLEIAAAGSR